MKIDFFIISIPEAWVVKEEGTVTSIYNPEGFGVFQISSFIAPDKYEINLFNELYDFASDYVKLSNSFEEFRNVKEINSGLLFDEIIEKDRKWLFTILVKNQKILLVTYNSLIEDFPKEHDAVLKILYSIRFDTD